MYIQRSITSQLQQALQQFPVLFLTGPRQSGKTTLLRKQLNDFRYVNLEDPELRIWAVEQPKDFLQQHPYPLIIDEAQYAPDLFSYIQVMVDEKQQTGMYVLSGSQNFLVMEKISQSLAGRSAIFRLLPFSYDEIRKEAGELTTNQLIIKGFYPRLYQSVTNYRLFYNSYLNTYIERDVRQLVNIGQHLDFMKFISLCAGRSAQLLNISSLATEAGIAYNTCKSWLGHLMAGYVVFLLQPHHKNFNKKIVKTPKLYFNDTGLLCSLLGIGNEETLALHPLRGAIFENLIFTELMKYNINIGMNQAIWFWRDNHGTEIDFLLEHNNRFTAIEVKSGMNFHNEYLSNLKKYATYNPNIASQMILYDGSIERSIETTKLLNWRNWMRDGSIF